MPEVRAGLHVGGVAAHQNGRDRRMTYPPIKCEVVVIFCPVRKKYLEVAHKLGETAKFAEHAKDCESLDCVQFTQEFDAIKKRYLKEIENA